MKKFIILFLLTSSITAQNNITDTIHSFSLNDANALWQNIYMSELNGDELKKSFKTAVISNMSLDNLQEIEDRITFEIKGDKVDIKKYGGKWGNTLIFVQYPLNYLVQVDFKKNKYRTTIKNIISDPENTTGLGSSKMEEVLTKKKGIEFKKGKTVTQGLSYLDQHFKEKFEISKIIEDNDDW